MIEPFYICRGLSVWHDRLLWHIIFKGFFSTKTGSLLGFPLAIHYISTEVIFTLFYRHYWQKLNKHTNKKQNLETKKKKKKDKQK